MKPAGNLQIIKFCALCQTALTAVFNIDLLYCPALVSVMEAADLGERHDAATIGKAASSRDGRVLVQGDRPCHTWTKAEEPGQKEAVAVSQAHALRSPPLEDLDRMAKGEIFGVEFGTGPQRPGDLAKDQSEHLGHAIQNKGQCRESPEINQNPGFWKR